MAKQFSNGLTDTRIYLDESTQTDWLDTEVKSSYNYAYHDVVKEVMEVYENFYETTTPFTYAIVANQQEYTIDSTLIKVTRVEINYTPTTSGTVAVRAIPIKSNEILTNKAFNNTSTSYFNAAYYLYGPIGSQKIGFVPVPQVADTTGKSISVWGIQMEADLVNNTDNINIPYADNYAQLVALKAAAMLLRKGQQAEKAASAYLLEYRTGIQEMKTFLKERQSDGVQVIQDAALEDIDFGSIGYS